MVFARSHDVTERVPANVYFSDFNNAFIVLYAMKSLPHFGSKIKISDIINLAKLDGQKVATPWTCYVSNILVAIYATPIASSNTYCFRTLQEPSTERLVERIQEGVG